MRGRQGALSLPLLLALDEIATICPLPSLPQIAAEGGGRNVILLAVLQDLSQAAARWGREVSDSLLTLAGAKLVLPGLADTETLQRLETLIGKHWVQQVSSSLSRSEGFFGVWTRGTYRSETELPRMPAHAIRQIAPDDGVVVVGRNAARTARLTGRSVCPWKQWARPLR